jgi:uncharacterized protein
MAEIIIHKYKDIDLKGATVVNGFPSLGLVSTITANYLIGALNLDQIGALDSDAFPPVSMIYASKPKFPARIYADEKTKMVVFLSEFTPLPKVVRPIARTMLSWAKEHYCSRIVAPEVLSVKGVGRELKVFGVGSTDSSREELKRHRIMPFVQGMVSGISGILLNEGRRADFDVVALLAQARPGMPDARAAAKIIEVIDRLVPTIKVDVEPLYEEAGRIEEYVRKLREQAKPATEPSSPINMYR